MHTKSPVGEIADNTAFMDTTQNWKLWCRLCAKDDPQGNINVFFKDEQCTNNSNLAGAIERYFWVRICRGEEMSEMLCTDCFSSVTALVNFNERVAKVQKLFEALQNSQDNKTIDYNELRRKYELLDDARMLMPEVHYFDAKPIAAETEEEEKLLESVEMTRENPLELPNIKQEDCMEEEICDNDTVSASKQQCKTDESSSDTDESVDNASDGDDSDEDEEYQPRRSAPAKAASASSTSSDDTEAAAELEALQETATKRRKLKKVPCKIKKKRTLKDVEIKLRKKRTPKERDENALKTKRNKEKDDEKYNIPCTKCTSRFCRGQDLNRHMRLVHKVMTELACPTCPRTFTTQHQLDRHATAHTPAMYKKVVPCTICDKKFTSDSLMKLHIKHMHENKRPIMCEECGMTVRTNAALKRHMVTHSDETPYGCEVCKKRFKNELRLKNHMAVHDSKKHNCTECGMQLNSRDLLNRHMVVHSDEMPHKCDYCGRAFKRGKTLKNHLILHTGLRPYSCPWCDRTFSIGSSLRVHKKNTHPEELAALEAAGAAAPYTKNIPKLETLKAVTKAADNLVPVAYKESGKKSTTTTVSLASTGSMQTSTTTSTSAQLGLTTLPQYFWVPKT